MTEPRVLSVWLNYYIFPSSLDQTREMAEQFEREHPEYRVDLRGLPYNDLAEEVAAAAERGEAPAVAEFFLTGGQEARDLRRPDGKPLFTSVEKAIGGRTEILGETVNLDDIVGTVREYYSQDGELLSLPARASSAILYGNRAVLEAAGITEMPSTWAELEAACAAVAALPDGPEYGISWPNHGWLFQQEAAQQGVPILDNDNGRSGRAERVDLASTALVDYAIWWKRLQDLGYFLYCEDIDTNSCWGGPFEAFVQQRVAFTISSSVTAGALAPSAEAAGFELVAGRFPYNGDLPCVGNVVGGDSMWLADGLDPEIRDGALAFMFFLNNPDNVVERHRHSFYMPFTRTAIDRLENDGWFAEKPYTKVVIGQLDDSDHSPVALGPLCGNLDGIQLVLAQAMHEVLTEGADPKERLVRATEDAQRLLDEYNAFVRGEGAPRSPRNIRLS